MKIEGTKEACDFLAHYPKDCKKIILKALREATKPVTRKVRSAVPVARWRKLVKTKAKESKQSGRVYAVAGMLDNGKVEQGKRIRDWTEAYFVNYGTLRRRDPSHKFDYAPRGKNSRNKMGISPRNFYDRAVDGLETNVTDIFLASIERQHEELLRKIK